MWSRETLCSAECIQKMKTPLQSNHPRVLIAGTHSGVGKTTVTLGLMSALREKGYKVQGFKAGPDYIDPSHHTAITERFSRNLDTWLLTKDVCLELFDRASADADIAVIEGVMGLYDGCLDGTELGSTAHLSKILEVPVVLVMDAKGMSRSAGAVVLGFKNFDEGVTISGVILNRVKSERHYISLKKSIEEHCKVPVLGYLPFHNEITLLERHLGLVPSAEQELSKSVYKKVGNLLSTTVDIDRLISIANSAKSVPSFKKTIFHNPEKRFNYRVAVASDEAFNFYYQDNLDLLEAYGVELAYFSPLYDKFLPADIKGLYIGGGFPELYAGMLASNSTMKESIQNAYKRGVVIYGECGGMMYLLEHLIDHKKVLHEMCGIFKATTRMEEKRQGLGYIHVEAVHDTILGKKGTRFRAHEFHWSSLHVPGGTPYAYKVSKYENEKTHPDGVFHDRALGSYAHIHFATDPHLLKYLLQTIEDA